MSSGWATTAALRDGRRRRASPNPAPAPRRSRFRAARTASCINRAFAGGSGPAAWRSDPPPDVSAAHPAVFAAIVVLWRATLHGRRRPACRRKPPILQLERAHSRERGCSCLGQRHGSGTPRSPGRVHDDAVRQPVHPAEIVMPDRGGDETALHGCDPAPARRGCVPSAALCQAGREEAGGGEATEAFICPSCQARRRNRQAPALMNISENARGEAQRGKSSVRSRVNRRAGALTTCRRPGVLLSPSMTDWRVDSHHDSRATILDGRLSEGRPA